MALAILAKVQLASEDLLDLSIIDEFLEDVELDGMRIVLQPQFTEVQQLVEIHCPLRRVYDTR